MSSHGNIITAPLDALRALLGACDAWQQWVDPEAPTEPEALDRIYLVQTPAPDRPYALIMFQPGWRLDGDRSRGGVQGTAVGAFEPSGQLLLRLESTIDDEDGSLTLAQRQRLFLDRCGQVIHELALKSRSGPFQITSIAAQSVPLESDPNEQSSEGIYWRWEFIVSWAGHVAAVPEEEGGEG